MVVRVVTVAGGLRQLQAEDNLSEPLNLFKQNGGLSCRLASLFALLGSAHADTVTVDVEVGEASLVVAVLYTTH
jgi:hypothetical protein